MLGVPARGVKLVALGDVEVEACEETQREREREKETSRKRGQQ